LQIIRPGIDIAIVVGGDAAIAIEGKGQIDADTAIRENGVAEDGIVDGSVASYNHPGAIYITLTAIEGDDVTRVSSATPHRRVVTRNVNPRPGVSQWLCPADVSANNVPLNQSVRCRGSENVQTNAAIAGDQITGRRAGSSYQPADDVIGTAVDTDAFVRIGQGNCSVAIGANKVALNQVVGLVSKGNAAIVSGNEITGDKGNTANQGI